MAGVVQPFFFSNIMSKSKRFYRITEDGVIQNVNETWEDIKLNDSFMDNLMVNSARKMTSVFPAMVIDPSLEQGKVHVNAINSSGDANWTVELPFLPITCPFKVDGDSLMTPAFGKTENPMVSVSWKPLEHMRLYWVVMITRSGVEKVPWTTGYQYVVAYHTDGTFHKLPVSNLYDDCRLCTGTYDGSAATHLEVLQKSWVQLVKAEWQGDLWHDKGAAYQERTDRLFRFKPAERGFEQLKPSVQKEKKWTDYTDKIATEWMTTNLIIA